MSDQKKPSNEPRGFAGLSSMVSKVEDVAPANESKPSKNQKENEARVSVGETNTIDPPKPKTKKGTSNKPAKTGNGNRVYYVYLAVVVGAIVWGLSTDKQNSSSNSSRSSSSSQWSATSNEQIEETPPVGTTFTLTQPQLRYCLAEEIRIIETKRIMDNSSQIQVDSFNAFINDYNSRCGRYKYDRSVRERARTETEARRSTLLQQAFQRVQNWH